MACALFDICDLPINTSSLAIAQHVIRRKGLLKIRHPTRLALNASLEPAITDARVKTRWL